jgi:hypothetical protein
MSTALDRSSSRSRPRTGPRGPLLRLRVWRNAAELDARLAEGAPPSSSPELALRAAQLLRWSHRDKLAGRLAELARRLPDAESAESLHALAVRVSRVDDREVAPVAVASCLVHGDGERSPRIERVPRADEARLVLRGVSL